MITAEKINHIKGETPSGCAACAFAMLFGIEETLARKAVKTRANGTFNSSVAKAIRDTGLTAHFVSLYKDFNELKDYLEKLSWHFPIYASCQYRHSAYGGGRGRNKIECHAILFADGKIYDSAQNGPVDFDCYDYTNDKGLTVQQIIIVDEERPNYGKKSFGNLF